MSGDRARREPLDEHFLPELPDDLFDWPEPRRDFGSRGRRQDDRPDGDTQLVSGSLQSCFFRYSHSRMFMNQAAIKDLCRETST